MLKTTDRYLLRSFIINYVLALFVMVSLYVTLHLFVNIDEFTEPDEITDVVPSVAQVARNMGSYYGYNLLLYFCQLSGVITLFAAALTLARMQKTNEMIALLASGWSMYRIAVPIVAAGLLLNALWILDQEVLMPKVAHKLARPTDDVEGRRVYGVWCLQDGPGRLLSARRFYPRSRTLANMMVLERDADGMLTGVITADAAHWDASRQGWVLNRGRHRQPGRESFDDFAVDEVNRPDTVTFHPSQLNPDEILLRQSAQWMQFLGVSQLTELQQRGVVNATQVAQVRHTRFTTPINNMLLLLLGIVFFLHREPGSVIVQGGKAIALCATCFIIAFMGQNLIGSFDVPTALPAWLPILLFAPLCAWLYEALRT